MLKKLFDDITVREINPYRKKPLYLATVTFLMDGKEKQIATKAVERNVYTDEELRETLRKLLKYLEGEGHKLRRHPYFSGG